MKMQAWIFILFATLITLISVGPVLADSPNYEIMKIEVNDVDVAGGQLDVERGELLTIRVRVDSEPNNTFVPDVRVEARIEGYEYGIISAISDIFSIDEGTTPRTYIKTVTLQVPEDIDSSEVYTLRVEVADSRDEEEDTVELHIDESRHNLRIFDILFNPSTTISAGQPLFVTGRIENLGEQKEEDILVTVRIPALGVQASNFIGRLITELDEEEEKYSFQDRSSSQLDLLLRMPADAASGMYEVEFVVDYNRGHDIITETRTIEIIGQAPSEGVETVLNVESTTKRANAGEEVVYRLMIANLGTEKGIYSIQLDGVSPWAEAWVEPGFLTVMPDSTGEAFIHVIPASDAEARDYVFSARVMLEGEVVNDLLMHTLVQGEADDSTPVTFKTMLAIIFGILVVILIVLGLVLALKGNRGDEGEEGQSYY